MASVFDDLDVGGSPLEAQIRQRWGRYGDWQSADQDQVADLARLLEANGITDLNQLQFSKRDYTRPVTVRETESGSQTDGGDTRTTFDVRYGDRDLGFLGDINRDGSVSVSGRGELTDRGDAGPILGWSSRGGGNTSYRLVEDPKTGQVVVVPTWGSSKTGSLQDARAVATIAAMAYGGYLYDGGTSAMSGLDSAMIDMGAGATNVGAAEVGSGGLMEAMGGTSAVEAGGGSLSKAALYGAEGYGAGMTGAETAAFDAGLQTAATQGANPSWWDTAKEVYTGADKFLNSGVGKLLGTGAALVLSKDAKQGPADPLLQRAGDEVLDIGGDARANADADREYFRTVFAPRYLGLMDRADARDRELYDFNMGRARRAAGQMDRFYDEVNAYDSEAGQNRAAGRAMATARQANEAQGRMLMRRAQAMGLNPGSGAWGAGAAQLSSRAALNEAFAANMARDAAKREGLNLRATAAGLRGADAGYAGNAAAGANMSLSALTTGQQGFNSNSNLWNATSGLGLNAFNSAGGWGLSRSNSADSISAANTAGWNGLIGYGLGQLLNRKG